MAEVLETFVAEERSAFFEKIDPELAADILVEFDEEERGELVATYSAEEIAQELVGNMDSDDAADMLSELPEDMTKEVLSQVEDVEQAKKLPNYLLTKKILRVP